jgi:glycosyltransferase involved in cell wall biosynthesis
VDHGRTGVLVPPDDPVALRHALATLLEDPAHAARLGAAGRAHVHATYGWDAVARRFLAIYARGPAAQRARP